MDREMEWVKCNLCGSEDFSLLFKGRDYRYFSPLAFKVMRCKRCGLVCLNPRPKEIIHYYAERKEVIEKDYFLFLDPDRIKKVKGLKKRGRILDIGFGHGYFLFDMSKEGWQVYGNELSKTGYDFARNRLGLENIYNSDLLSLNFPENFFDVVTMWHTLEHMKKPQEILRRINRLLKDGGVLIVECPNFSSLQSRFFKEKWYALDLPRHLYQFTHRVLERLLKLASFEIYKRDYVANPRISFISLKKSLLSWLAIRRAPNREEIEESTTITNLRKSKILWRLVRFVFNLICLLLSLFLISVNSDSCSRVYCKKIERL